MKQLISIVGLLSFILMAGCGDEGDDAPGLGDRCDIAKFKPYCNAQTFIYCDNSTNGTVVHAAECAETCASLNGAPACRFLCLGSKVGDTSYSCYSGYELLESTCIQGDDNVLLRVDRRIECRGLTSCKVVGTQASCQ